MENRRIIGTAFSVLALVAIGLFIAQADFSIQLQKYLSLKYLMQFSPLTIYSLLLISGVYLFVNKENANFVLAVFGYAALEEIVFDWFGVTSSHLPAYSTVIIVCCSIAALWIAHSNSFNLKKLSYRELALSVTFGAVESLLPNYL